MPRGWSRRDVIKQCLAAGVLIVPAGWTESDVLHAWFEAQRQSTPHVEMGPFYKKRAPADAMMRHAGDRGLPHDVSGRVINVHGEPVPGATIEVWQADDGGLYDLEGYRFRAALKPSATGSYGFQSVMPGHYPARVARHVHYFVNAPGHKPLSTQLYFATDEVFDGNPDKNFTKDPLITERSLVRPVVLGGNPANSLARVEFELVMEKA